MKSFIYYLKYWLNVRLLYRRIMWQVSKKDLDAILKYDHLDILN